MEQKRQAEEIKQLELKNKNQQEKNIVPINNKKKNEEPGLFDSIRNDIEEDRTNIQSAPAVEEKMINSPALYNDTEEKSEPELLRPMMRIPSSQEQNKNIQPAVNEQMPSSQTQPAENIQNNKPDTEQKNQQDSYKHVPYYDWNLKNIYLQKIGRLSNLN